MNDNIRKVLMAVGIVVAIAVLPFVFGNFTANEIIVLAVFAMAYNLLLGYGGELSFGHAAFFGLGAYATVIVAEHIIANLYAAMLLAVLITGAFSVIFAYVSLRRRGIYLAMITLALAQMVYYIAFRWTDLTGGSDGMFMPLYDAALGPIDPLQGGLQFYVFALIILAAVWLAIHRIIESPFGRALMAVRESEERARHIGYDPDRLLLLAFIMSGTLSGLAGAMNAVLYAFVGPDQLFWIVSGEVVLITILGGLGTLNGPVIGAIIFGVLAHNLTSVTEHWPVVFGAIFVLIVMFAPQGVYGLYLDYHDGELSFEPPDFLQGLLPR